MESLRGPIPTCSPDRLCLEWAHKYLKDCVCSLRDEVSFALGLMSVVCWGVAEVPQIITNFRERSTEGVSLTFLMTWVVGDVFNLAGCYLEPSTLPTQFYTALLYTITTLVLVGQVIYYDHILKWKKEKAVGTKTDIQEQAKDSSLVRPSKISENVDAVAAPEVALSSKPIPASPQHARIGSLYYMSARSLASSHTPTAGSYLAGSRGSGSRGSYSFLQHASLEESNGHLTSLTRSHLTSLTTSHSAPPINAASVLRAVVSSAFCVGGLNIHSRLSVKPYFRRVGHGSHSVFALHPGRKLLEARYREIALSEGGFGGSLGIWLGWLMAAIYMGGRLPQISLNIKRGSVEGLNPLMFTFALLGNVTYVGSILVRNTEWSKIKSNMPWLVDAGVCVVLDFFIICQFIYYYSRKPKQEEDNGGDYKPLQ